jgi:hypothetical protein
VLRADGLERPRAMKALHRVCALAARFACNLL